MLLLQNQGSTNIIIKRKIQVLENIWINSNIFGATIITQLLSSVNNFKVKERFKKRLSEKIAVNKSNISEGTHWL